MQTLNKETHVFIKTEDSFTSIEKKTSRKGLHQVFTTKKIKISDADAIESLYPFELTVERINTDKGFILIRVKNGTDYRKIVSAIKTVYYEK